MRVIREVASLVRDVDAARAEARAAFGSDEVYLEKLVERARHVEVQVIGDLHGNVIHLYERDCSVQRRHQKLVERAPAPYLAPEQRVELCQHALAIASAVGYVGAGTVEFLMDVETGDFHFIEVNPRIQVEHTVTEAVTGIDLVAMQLGLAAGRSLSDLCLEQRHVPRPRGFAVQLRVNAESLDADGGVRPGSGTLAAFDVPTGPGVRVDTCGYAGYRPNPSFDSLLAKVIVHGNDREEALSRMGQALDSFILEGITTTIPFLARVIRHPDFVAGKVDTRFLERESHLLRPPDA